jgi:hypothetical protein
VEERNTWQGEWMMRWGKGPPDQRVEEGWMTHGSRGKVALENDITGEGPTLAKHRAAEKDGIVQAPLIRAR